MEIVNVVDVTKKALAQTLGTTYMANEATISAIESGKLIDIGRDVLNAEKGVDNFCKALIDVVGKIEFANWMYEPEIKSIYKDSWEWGAFLERVKFEPNILENDDLFNLVDGKDYSTYEHKAYIPKISVKIYQEKKGITIPLTIKTSDIETAFTSMGEMTRFISAIRENVSQTKKAIMDAYAHLLVGAGIAISEKVTKSSVHLLTEAKEKGIVDQGATAKTAITNAKFNNFCLQRIATIRDYMKRHTLAFNNKNVIPPSGNTNLILLNEFEKACRFVSEAETFHPDKLSVGEYDVVSMWQSCVENLGEPANKENYDFETVSSVFVNDTANKLGIGSEARVSNCIAFLADEKAIGINNEKEKTTSSYTASADFWNEFLHLSMNYVLDSDYSMVAFLLD